MKRLCFILPLAALVLTACEKEQEQGGNESEYLVFGHYYGECIGEVCVETFKLTASSLYEDTNDHYAGTEPYHFIALPGDKFELVKDLYDAFPTALLDEDAAIIGCPDCADQGGLFIQFVKDGMKRSWKIDQSKNQVPAYLHSFMDQVNEKITLINLH